MDPVSDFNAMMDCNCKVMDMMTRHSRPCAQSQLESHLALCL